MILGDIVTNLQIDRRKLTEYALNFDNPKGSHKAYMFQQHLGYTKNNYESLLTQIQQKALDAEAISTDNDKYGQRYQFDLEIRGISDDKIEKVRTRWIVKPLSKTARLVTLYLRKNHD